jgi:hypothetical protein
MSHFQTLSSGVTRFCRIGLQTGSQNKSTRRFTRQASWFDLLQEVLGLPGRRKDIGCLYVFDLTEVKLFDYLDDLPTAGM